MAHHWEKLTKDHLIDHLILNYSNIVSAIDDHLTPAKLHFCCYVAGIFESFLVKYQSDKPTIPFLYSNLSKVMNIVLLLALKPDIVLKYSMALPFYAPIHSHPLPSTPTNLHPLLPTSTHSHPLPPTSMHSHPLPPTPIHSYPLPSTPTHSHL